MSPATPIAESTRSAAVFRWSGAIRVLLLLLFLGNALYSAAIHSGVADELAVHIPSGYLYATSGQFSGGLANPPLGQVLIALPVVLLGRTYELFTQQHLFLFRLPVILLGVLLVFLVERFTTRLHGPRAGLIALFLCCLSPNLLAHSALATLDLPIAAFVFLTCYLLLRHFERPGTRSLLLVGLAMTASILTKVQGLLLLPLATLAVLILRPLLWRPRWSWAPAAQHARRPPLAAWLLVPLVLVVGVDLAYLHLPLRDGGLLPHLFLTDMASKALHSTRGNFAYLLGHYSDEGWWYYFPLAILLKTPLPLLGLLGLGLIARPDRSTLALVLLPVALFLGAAMASHVDIGLRHVLIVYPFFCVLAGAGGLRLWRMRRGRWLLAGLLLWYGGEAVWIAPHHLSYFNTLAGGPAHGYRYLLDSNYDWGQNDRYLRQHIRRTGLDYKIDPPAFTPTDGHILVNANALYGIINGGERAYRWLKPYPPVGRIAYTWFEFDIPPGSFPPHPAELQARQALHHTLFTLQDAGRELGLEDRQWLYRMADLAARVHAYDLAWPEIRALLARDPADGPALLLGGRLTVRHRIGVLEFTGDEYLTGIPTPRPDPRSVVPLPRIAEMARAVGVGPGFAELYLQLAEAQYRAGRSGAAGESLTDALLFDPGNAAARRGLERLRTAG
jgi:hypothetical protein